MLLLLSLILVPTTIIPGTHFILEKLYPPVEKKLLFGLLRATSNDDRLEIRKAQSIYLLWGLAGVGVLGGLVLYAPIVRFSAEAEKVRLLKSLQQASGGKGPFDLEERYRIDAEIGSGAMGVVNSAFDKTLKRNVAIKELPAVYVKTPERRERFLREALTLARLTHPGIVHIYDLLDDGERMILVLELVSGGTLEDLIDSRAPVPVSDACRLITQICEALDHVHQSGIVHRDLKPNNILIDKYDNPKVTDFGVARLVQESGLTLEGSLIGTPSYMSPEQAAGKATDFRSDIYSLGIIFYELLSGSPPFAGESVAVLLQQISDQPSPLTGRIDGVEENVEKIVMAMLEKNPDDRLSDYQDILKKLQAIQS